MVQWAGTYCDTQCAFPPSGAIRVYDLAQALEPGMVRHPAHPPFAFTLAKQHGQDAYPGGITAASELFAMGAHVGTHVDALGHIALDGKVHGGVEVEESPTHGLANRSVEEVPPLLGRGHLIDLPALLGRDPTAEDGIGPDEFERWFGAHDPPGAGSVVLVRTGWMRYWDDADRYLGLHTGLPGVTREGAKWLTSRGILATGSDTMNYEHRPTPGVPALSVHVHLLVEQGVYIMESMNLEKLAEDAVTDFTFFAVPLRIRGGTGSPLRPLAIVSRERR